MEHTWQCKVEFDGGAYEVKVRAEHIFDAVELAKDLFSRQKPGVKILEVSVEMER